MEKDARVAILLPPVKSIARMLMKVHEYRLNKTSKWPHALSVGDVLRATIVCADGDTLLEAWGLISSPTGFDVRPEHGRLKNLMATTLPRPPCMLINVIVDSDDGNRPVLAEVQIELRSIIELAMAQHKARAIRRVLSHLVIHFAPPLSAVWVLYRCARQYYEIRRAKTMAEICGAHHGDATVQKELSAIRQRSLNKDAPQIKAPTLTAAGGDRSKVHPADKYIEEGLASPVVDVSRAPSAMGPEVDDMAVAEL